MKVFSLVGPTGAGKTAIALELGQQYVQEQQSAGLPAEVHLVSVDSRQVYKGLEIVSGADLPTGFERLENQFPYPYFKKANLFIHGVSCIAPHQEWSVAHFQEFVWRLLAQLEADAGTEHLVILVGGTGLYHDNLTQFDSQLHIGPNLELRARWEEASLTDLQAELLRVSPTTFAHLTPSDQHNPRRLVRHLEIIVAKADSASVSARPAISPPQILQSLAAQGGIPTVGVMVERTALRDKITARVKERLEQGAVAEATKLIQMSSVSPQLLTATGVAEIRDYMAGKIREEELLEKWVTREYQYAKRQLTWWRHDERVRWLAPDNRAAWLTLLVTL